MTALAFKRDAKPDFVQEDFARNGGHLPGAGLAWLDARRPLPAHVAYLEQRYAGEPYRLALSLLAADLEAASREDMTARLLDEVPHAARITAAEVRAVVDLVAQGIPPRPACAPATPEFPEIQTLSLWST